jgi:conserved hypothetical phage tail region protein
MDKKVEWSLPVVFHFSVKLGTSEVSFSEASGLETSIETKDVRNGGDNSTTYHLPERIKFSELVLKRGQVSENDSFFSWCKQNMDTGSSSCTVFPQSIEVSLLNEKNNPLATWRFEGAYPFKWSFSTLDAMKNEISIETISLKYWNMKRTK